MHALRIEIARDSLTQALHDVIQAVAVAYTQPTLQGIRIRADLDGVTLMSAHAHMSVRIRLPRNDASVTVEKVGSIVVSLHYLYHILRKLDHKSVILEIKQPLLLAIVSGSFRMRLCGMDDSEFSCFESGKEASSVRLRINSAIFRSSIKQVAGAAATSDSRPVLTGVLLEYDQGRLRLTAADGIRLASRTLEVDDPADHSVTAIIPAKSVQVISKMLEQADETMEVEIGRSRITFVAGYLEIESVLIQGTFPSVKNMDSEVFLCECRIDRLGLLHATEGVTIMAGEKIIRLAANQNRLHLSSKKAEIGEAENEVPVRAMTGEGFVLSLNGKLLTEILRSSDCAELRIRYAGSMAPLVICPEDSSESTLFLITSVRTSESFSA